LTTKLHATENVQKCKKINNKQINWHCLRINTQKSTKKREILLSTADISVYITGYNDIKYSSATFQPKIVGGRSPFSFLPSSLEVGRLKSSSGIWGSAVNGIKCISALRYEIWWQQ